ncbi:MAG: hypothetical protein MJY44_02885 [Bacteroidales bacterium]|nr:hypothetical protein [Bacteroidales bacterium]
MKNSDIRKDRSFSRGHSPKAALATFQSICLLSFPVLAVNRCTTDRPEEPESGDDIPAVRHSLRLRAEAGWDLARLDVFIYEDDGIPALDTLCTSFSGAPTTSLEAVLEVREGTKRIYTVANSPYDFNAAAIKNAEAVESLTYDFADDRPEAPISTGYALIDCQTDTTLTIRLQKIMCTIEIGHISNSLGDRILSPVIRLEDAARSAEAFRQTGFHPGEYITDSILLKERMTIGLEEINTAGTYVGKRLYCYPNESSSRPTRIVFEYGPPLYRRSKTATVGALSRGESKLETFEIP